jgi:transcription elongation factor Elf1
MPHLSEGRHGVYRCPVCSYRDMVVLQRGAARAVVICAHCETPLDLSARGDHSLTLAVQVAERHRPSP